MAFGLMVGATILLLLVVLYSLLTLWFDDPEPGREEASLPRVLPVWAKPVPMYPPKRRGPEMAHPQPLPRREEATPAPVQLSRFRVSAHSVAHLPCPRCNGRCITRLVREGMQVRSWCRRCGHLRINRRETLDV